MAGKKKRYIGIYIEYNNINISYANIKEAKISISNVFNIPVDYKIEGLIKPLSINSDFFNEKQEWLKAFKETLKKIKTETNSVIITLSHNFSITRFFTMPFIERKFWHKAVPIESKKYIPVAFDELGYDFYAFPVGENTRLGVVFSVTHKKTTEFLNQILKECGFILEAVEPVSHSYYRFSEYVTRGRDSYIFIYEDNDEFYISVLWNKIPILFRYISFSKAASFSERRSLDLKGSIMFLQRNIPNSEIKEVYACARNQEFITSHVKKEIQIEPKIIDLKNLIDLQNTSFGLIMSASSSLNESIKTDYIIDISENQKNKRAIAIVNRFVIILTTAISLFFLFLYTINTLTAYLNKRKISQYYSQMPGISEFEDVNASGMEDKIKQICKIARVMKSAFQNRDYFTPKLAALADTIPKDIWLKSITYTNPPSIDPSIASNIDMTVEGETYLVGDSRSYYMDYFIKELKKKKAFEVFTPPRGNLDYEVKNPENPIGSSSLTEISKDYKGLISKIKITASGKK